MTELLERDKMICRSCGQEERASEGYPCKDCGTFICIMCVFKGVVQCEKCVATAVSGPAKANLDSGSAHSAQISPEMHWPDH